MACLLLAATGFGPPRPVMAQTLTTENEHIVHSTQASSEESKFSGSDRTTCSDICKRVLQHALHVRSAV